MLPEIAEALEGAGIITPFPIQEMTLSVALLGTDLIGQARTGTGKTLAFGIPLLQRTVAPHDPEHDDLDAALERVQLAFVGHSAVHGEDAGAAVARGELEVAGDLERQLTGRGDDEGLRLVGVSEVGVVDVVRGDGALQHGDPEGQRLAGAGAGLADQVGAQQGDREGHLLDGEGSGDAGALERVTDLGEDPELAERGQWSVAFVSQPRVGSRWSRSDAADSSELPGGAGALTASAAHMLAGRPLACVVIGSDIESGVGAGPSRRSRAVSARGGHGTRSLPLYR